MISLSFDVANVYLFGSFLNNKHSSDSDIAVVLKSKSKDFLKESAELCKLRSPVDLRIESVLFEPNKDHSGFLD